MKNLILFALIASAALLCQSTFAQCPAGTLNTIVSVEPLGFPEEISWEVVRVSADSVVLSRDCGSYTSTSVQKDSACLVAGAAYEFRAYDDWGDGWNGGSYEIEVDGAVVGGGLPNDGLSGDNAIGCDSSTLEETFVFLPGAAIAGCTDPAAVNYNPAAVFDDGSCIYPASNDECEDAILLVNGACYNGTNVGASFSSTEGTIPGSYACAGVSPGGEVDDIWFKVAIPVSGVVGIDITAVPGITSTMLFLEGSCGAFTPLSGYPCANYGPGNGIVLTGLTPGDTLFIRYWDFGSNDYGPLEVCITEPISGCMDPCAANYDSLANIDDGSCVGFPAGAGSDDCTSATFLPGPGAYSHYIGGATASESSSCLSVDTASVWFSYVVKPGLDSLWVYTCGSSYDTGLSIWDDCGAAGSEMACSDDDTPGGGSTCGDATNQSFVFLAGGTLGSLAGDTILIRVAGFDGATGCGELVIEEFMAPSDSCSALIDVQNLVGVVTATSLDLTWDAVPGSFGCQVGFGVSGTTLGGARNLIGAEISSASIPVSFIPPGTYDLHVRCGCQISPTIVVTGYSNIVTITIPSPRLARNDFSFAAYPVPANETLYLQFEAGESLLADIEIVDLSGRSMRKLSTQVVESNSTVSVDLQGVEEGTYLLKVNTEAGSAVERITVIR